jgi:hypothetical protein
MTEADARYASQLFAAIAELPKVRRALSDKPTKYHDSTHLGLSAAEMSDGFGQGSNHYFYLPPALGRAILDAAEPLIRAEMKRLGLIEKPKRGRRK